jgi:hypothetical protein
MVNDHEVGAAFVEIRRVAAFHAEICAGAPGNARALGRKRRACAGKEKHQCKHTMHKMCAWVRLTAPTECALLAHV